MNAVDYSKVLREDVTGTSIPVTPLRAHKSLCGIASIRKLRLVAVQEVVRLVVDDVGTPVQEESAPVGFVVESPSDLGSVWSFVDPIIDEVTHVDPILVLEYHVVQDAAGVHNVDDLEQVIHGNGILRMTNLFLRMTKTRSMTLHTDSHLYPSK